MCIGKSGHSTEHNTVSSEQYTDEDIEIETKKCRNRTSDNHSYHTIMSISHSHCRQSWFLPRLPWVSVWSSSVVVVITTGSFQQPLARHLKKHEFALRATVTLLMGSPSQRRGK